MYKPECFVNNNNKYGFCKYKSWAKCSLVTPTIYTIFDRNFNKTVECINFRKEKYMRVAEDEL